ncbi:DnaA regulatory inactivator Hda [Ectothiorhodospiraceae bacterium BW-2]|nr:DnaA regulatory inactivator Hda [Ectothiorhodospiraceae bacterium BW-2]
MTTQRYPQPPLNVQLRPSFTLHNFVIGANHELFNQLYRKQSAKSLFIWGEAGCGKSHLLQAMCQQASQQGVRSIYLPLEQIMALGVEILRGCDQIDLVAIDSVSFAATTLWEESLFHLFNQLRHNHHRLLVADRHPPEESQWQLNDLLSRWRWGPVYQLQPMDEAALIEALQLRAQDQGLSMSPQVGHYLLKHISRDTTKLFRLMDDLDYASLATQRRLTIPFIKQHLLQT